MATLTRKQREVQEREVQLLDVARKMLLKRGYHGLTMARVADALQYSKGTIYSHFACKEDIIVALATQSVDIQRGLVERAATFRGRTRERMVAIGVATELFARLYPADARIFQIMNGEAITQKASKELLWRMRASALRTVNIIRGICNEAIVQGDLAVDAVGLDQIVFHMWLVGEAGKASVSSWMPPQVMGVTDPLDSVIQSSHKLGDGFGWRPLSTEWDYGETLRRVWRAVFPEELVKVSGEEWRESAPALANVRLRAESSLAVEN